MAANVQKSSDKKSVTNEDREPGVVYIGHVPHGFYERQLRKYFSQFGVVLSVKLSRSQKSGKSKGYAFVKFKYAAVAKTVADTCHNYLFFNKLLKCEYKPLSEIHKDTFFSYAWKPNNKSKRLHNSAKTDSKLDESLQRSARRKQSKLNKLKDLGIELKLEDVMNVPESAKRKPRPKPELTEASPEDVENGAAKSADPALLTKTVKSAKKKPLAGEKIKKSRTAAITKELIAPTKTPKTVVKEKASKKLVSAKTQKRRPDSVSAGRKTPGTQLSAKKVTKASPSGVKGRQAKPPPAKRVKRE